MVIINFEKALAKAQNRHEGKKPESIYYFNVSLHQLYHIVNSIKEKKTNLDQNDLLQELMNRVNSITRSAFLHSRILSTVASLNAALYFKSHLNELKAIEKQLKTSGYNPDDVEYGKSFKKDCRSFVIELLDSYNNKISNYKSNVSPDLYSLMETGHSTELRSALTAYTFLQQKEFLKIASYVKYGLVSYIDSYIETLKKNSQDLLINAICSSIMHLADFNVLDKYIDRYNKQIKNLIPKDSSSAPTISDGDSIIKAIKIAHATGDTSYLKALLKNISFDNLVFMNTFFINRLVKETSDFVYSIFYAYKLDLFKEWLIGNKVFPTDEEAKYIRIGTSILTYPANYFYISQVRNYSHTKSNIGDQIKVNLTAYIQQVSNKWNTKLEAFFSAHLQHFHVSSLQDDLKFFIHLYNPIFMQYEYKDKSVVTSLISLSTSKTQNWGLSPTKASPYDPSHKTTGFSIDTDLNFPFRFHVSTSLLADFFMHYHSSSKVPIYLGIDDFMLTQAKLATNHILLPLSPTQKKSLRNLHKKYPHHTGISHMLYLSDKRHFPEHLKMLCYSKTGQPIYKHTHFYIDLATGKIFQKNGEQFKEISAKQFDALFNHAGFDVGDF